MDNLRPVKSQNWTLDGSVEIKKIWKINSTGIYTETRAPWDLVQLNPIIDILIINNW